MYFRPLESQPARKKRAEQRMEVVSLERIVQSTEEHLACYSVTANIQPKDMMKYRMMQNLVQQVKDDDEVTKVDVFVCRQYYSDITKMF